MIIDNADDNDMFFGAKKTGDTSFDSKCLSEFLPQCSNGSIIFTTRNKKAGVKFATAGGVIHLREMVPVDAEKLLKARLGEDNSDQDGMTKLLELLGVSGRIVYCPELDIDFRISSDLQRERGG